MDFNKKHPELRAGEIFITNVRDPFNEEMGMRDAIPEKERGWYAIGWTTKRIGWKAYDINGRPLPYSRPVFVKRKEIIVAGLDPNKL